MQASLPKIVRMVSVDDLGQGSESIRILGVRWLPKGAASKTVSGDGSLESGDEQTQSGSGGNKDKSTDKNQKDDKNANNKAGAEDASKDANDRPEQASDDKENQGQESSVAPGMEAEEGEFFNLEIAFAYKTSNRKAHERAKNAHLYLQFYLPGNIKVRKSTSPSPMWLPCFNSALT